MRPRAISLASIPPAISIWDKIQPPKMSPLGFVSFGMATALNASKPRGCRPFSFLSDIWFKPPLRFFLICEMKRIASAFPVGLLRG
jgi:hypothetical protein